MDGNLKDKTLARSACTECQRRKQKCNRLWPCNHCQKRKVADKCRFSQVVNGPEKPPSLATKKRTRDTGDGDSASDVADESGGEGFEALGYMHSNFFTNIPVHTEKQKPTPTQYFMTASSCPQLQRALQILPPRTTTDSLVQSFLTGANFHFYIIYPPSFLQEYQDWWVDRQAHRPLGLQWTCLLLAICACSLLHASPDVQHKLEPEFGEPADKLDARFHNAARELHSVIPVGHNHLLTVQQLLHSCLWYKTQARFVEACHVLSAAIREAQELGINQERTAGVISEFDREMRRRVWCILDVWDWQISGLLSRPRIIDRSDGDVGLPSLTLEDYSTSPLLHMKIQSELIGKLADRFRSPKDALAPHEVQEYIDVTEAWMRNLPKVYDFESPDTSQDSSHSWITLHRHRVHLMSYLMVLDPVRPYMSRSMSRNSPSNDHRIRRQGVDYALKLIQALHRYLEYLHLENARFQFGLFAVFYTAAILCSALIHDEDNSIPRRAEIFNGVQDSLHLLQQLTGSSRSARASYDILLRLSQRTTLGEENTAFQPPSRIGHGLRDVKAVMTPPPPVAHSAGVSFASSDVASPDGVERQPMSPKELPMSENPLISGTPPTYYNLNHPSANFPHPSTSAPMTPSNLVFSAPTLSKRYETGTMMQSLPNVYVPPTPQGRLENMGFDAFHDEQFGGLAALWNRQGLDTNPMRHR